MNKPIDTIWYERLQDICRETEEVEWLQKNMNSVQEERELFFLNEIENPLFEYTKPTQVAIVQQKANELLADIQNNESDAIVSDLYARKIKNQITRTRLATASGESDDTAFYVASSELYGKPRKKYFAYVAKRVTELYRHADVEQRHVANKLYKTLSRVNATIVDIDTSILPPVVIDNTLVTTVDEAVAIFLETLKTLGIDGWSVVVEEHTNRSRFSVNAHKKIVYIPNQAQLDRRSKKMTRLQLEALAQHEIGVHARRAHAGANSTLRLLSIGLDSYIRGEEGLASFVQQQIEGAYEFYGFDRYLAASLAVGMDGKPRDFRGVFALMTEFYQLQFLCQNQDADITRAQNAAWEVCVRIFRGTTGQTPGCVYTKDIVYMEGNIEMWNLMSQHPDRYQSFFVGKYNPLLSRHVKALQTLGILTQD
jgi:hypothetical protein